MGRYLDKAGFRALRESTGIGQDDLAALMDVELRSVKRWESDLSPMHHAPLDAWKLLKGLAGRRDRWAAIILTGPDGRGWQSLARGRSIMLPYWTGEAQWRRSMPDAPAGPDWKVFNAAMRRVAAVMEARGCGVEWVVAGEGE